MPVQVPWLGLFGPKPTHLEEAVSEYEKLGTELEQAFTKLRTPDGHAADR